MFCNYSNILLNFCIVHKETEVDQLQRTHMDSYNTYNLLISYCKYSTIYDVSQSGRLNRGKIATTHCQLTQRSRSTFRSSDVEIVEYKLFTLISFTRSV